MNEYLRQNWNYLTSMIILREILAEYCSFFDMIFQKTDANPQELKRSPLKGSILLYTQHENRPLNYLYFKWNLKDKIRQHPPKTIFTNRKILCLYSSFKSIISTWYLLKYILIGVKGTCHRENSYNCPNCVILA